MGMAGYTPHEGGPRGLDPSGCQPSIREAVLGHRRDVTLRYGWIWGLGYALALLIGYNMPRVPWTECHGPTDWA